MKKEYPRRPPTNDNLYDYFLSRVRANLHVVLCFSPVGEKFQNRALKFPGNFLFFILNYTTKELIVDQYTKFVNDQYTNKACLL